MHVITQGHGISTCDPHGTRIGQKLKESGVRGVTFAATSFQNGKQRMYCSEKSDASSSRISGKLSLT